MAIYYPRCRVHFAVLLEDWQGGVDETIHSFDAVPRSVTIERNSHRQADTVDLELDYRDVPFDPRSLRQVKVEVYLGDTQDPTAALAMDASTLGFVGHIDEPETSLEGGGETVRLRGRDDTALFLDHRWPGTSLRVDRGLDQVVKDVLAEVTGAADMRVSWSAGASSTKLSDLIGRKVWAPQEGDDSWTVLVDLCGRAGLVPTVRLGQIEILSAAEVKTRTAVFLYGRNLSRLEFKRKFNGVRAMQVEVRCWDAAKREVRSAKYPKQPIVLRKKIGTDKKVSTETAPLLPWYVAGTYTAAALDALAERLYNDAARGEVEGTLETADLLDLAGATEVPRLANGDAVTVTLGNTDVMSLAAMAESQAVSFLEGRGFASSVASALVAALKKADRLTSTFYVTTATHRWDREQGYSLSAVFNNYVGDTA